MGLYLFSPPWWRYILGKPVRGTGILRAAICRWRGHPAGVWWFTNYALEPDMRCKNCGDDLG